MGRPGPPRPPATGRRLQTTLRSSCRCRRTPTLCDRNLHAPSRSSRSDELRGPNKVRRCGLIEAVTGITAQIVEEVAQCRIKLVASLPDTWISDLIEAFDQDQRFIHVPVNREESAIGLCSGAFFSGTGALALMGASGFMTCIYALTKINYSYQIPLLIFITLRGGFGDHAKYHVSNGLYLLPLMDSISMPYVIVDTPEKVTEIPRAYTHSRVMNRPVVVGFTRSVLRGEQ
ncbi:MAG: hypothetical protein ACREQA_23830 [Candidatus Binatia bacterium]